MFGGAKTGFKELDKQRALSYLKIEKLLVPLWNKTLPLHNNEAELDVRGKQCLGYLSWAFKSCRKLKVNFYQKIQTPLIK